MPHNTIEKRNRWAAGYRAKNREGIRSYMRTYRDKTRETHRAYMKKYYWKQRARIDAIKAGKPCMDCGKTYPPYVMDFDHRDPKLKSHVIGNMHFAMVKRLEEEAAKCDLVCANCHRERTHRQQMNGIIALGRKVF